MTITKEGELASFYTVNKAPIKHLRVYFSPKQIGEGDPSPENVREISGWDKVYIDYYGKNLCQQLSPNIITGYIRDDNGIEKVSSNYFYISTLYPVLNINEFGICGIQSQAWRPYFLDNAKNFISRGYVYSSPQKIRVPLKIDMPDNCAYVQLQILNNSDISDLQIYNQVKNWNISFPTTVYGGYVDLITGELIQTHKYILLNDPDKWGDATGSDVIEYQYSDKFTDRKTFSNSYEGLICTYAPVRYISSGYLIYGRWRTYSGNNAYTFGLRVDKTNISLDTIKTDATAGKIGICYELATPITHQLTSQQIQTFIGRNNIWSNADRVEVEYDLAESNDELYKRRNIILRSSPHIETASSVDGVATCTSNLKAPLKSCKITFEPYQLGVGDSSPTNIRPISGWSTLNVYTADDMHYMVPNNWSSISDSGANIVYLGNGKYYVKLLGASDYIYSDWYPVKPFTIPTGDGRRFCMNNDDIQYFTIRFGDSSGTEFDGWSCSGETNRVRTGYAAMRDKLLANVKFNYKGNSEGCFKLEFIKNLRTTNTITLPSTFYGGYVDLLNGQLVQTHKKYKISDFTWAKSSRGKLYMADASNIDLLKPIDIISDSYKSIGAISAISSLNDLNIGDYYHFIDNKAYGRPAIRDDRFSTADAFVESMKDAEIVAELANPIIYQITPQQLTALKGVNNIWSNANGPIEVQYWTH